MTVVIPPALLAEPLARGVIGALTTDDQAPTPLQLQILEALYRRAYGRELQASELAPLAPGEVAEVITEPALRSQLAHLVVVLELLRHPLPPEVEQHAESYLRSVGVETPFVQVCRDTARDHLARLHADIIRNSWFTEETVSGIFHGRLLELARSKLSYYAVGHDEKIARRWRATGDCPEGSWGRAVFDFYDSHGFPFPGEKHGIYEVGARHDWVHVLTDYGTDPEGEIDVFAFIAGTMTDPKGFVQFIFTLALFQNASISTVGGKKVVIARADTLADPGAAERLADAFLRAETCTVDPMGGLDPFDHANEPLDELRTRWKVVPKGVDGPPAIPR